MIRYGLLHLKTKQLLGFYTVSSDGADDCVSVQYILDQYENRDKLWIVRSRELAEAVRLNSTAWYNASYETPSHAFTADELKVVEVTISYA